MPIFTVGAAGTTSDTDLVTNSLRFDSGSDENLSRTPSSAGNRRTFTFSAWVKRAKISGSDTQHLFEVRVDSNDNSGLSFQTDDTLFAKLKVTSGTQNTNLRTNRVFRDVSAWYHIVWAVDTTQATESNRAKLYVNGVEETSFSNATYLTQNTDTTINNTNEHQVGSRVADTSQDFDGYMSEVVLVDGQQLTPTSFGEFDSDTGIWKPIDVSGLTFGTNGFYLNFKNSGSLGADVSGNGNNLTVTNLTSDDQSLDNPTNNFCTINPLTVGPRNAGQDSSGVITLGATKCAFNGSGDDFGGTMAVSTGKWYWETKLVTSQNHGSGFVDVEHFYDGDYDASNGGIVNANGYVGSAENSTNSVYVLNGTATSSAASYADNDIVGYAFDVDAGEMKIYQNGTLRDTITSIPTGVTYIPIIGDDSSTDASFEVNFGGSSGFTISSGNSDENGYGNFEYSVPSGYYALCTKNLAEFG